MWRRRCGGTPSKPADLFLGWGTWAAEEFTVCWFDGVPLSLIVMLRYELAAVVFVVCGVPAK